MLISTPHPHTTHQNRLCQPPCQAIYIKRRRFTGAFLATGVAIVTGLALPAALAADLPPAATPAAPAPATRLVVVLTLRAVAALVTPAALPPPATPCPATIVLVATRRPAAALPAVTFGCTGVPATSALGAPLLAAFTALRFRRTLVSRAIWASIRAVVAVAASVSPVVS